MAAGAWVWVELPAGDSVAFAQVAERNGVLVTPGPVFSPGAHLQRHLRLTTLAPSEVIEEGVARLARAWEAFARQPGLARPAARLVI